MSLPDRSGRIKHDSATPVSVQVAADIEPISMLGGSRLTREVELAEQYGVARVTVRRALEELRERGKAVTVHGRGTYVYP